jgi:hypothetical protein
VHGRKDGISKLVDGFLELLQQQADAAKSGDLGAPVAVPSKLQVRKRILDIAERKRAADESAPASTDSANDQPPQPLQHGSARWVVRPETAQSLNLQVTDRTTFIRYLISPNLMMS